MAKITGTSKFRQIITRIHIYGGLYSAAYLLFMGITGFLFNHESLIPKKWESVEYTRGISAGENIGKDSLITSVMNELEIFGHRPYWLQWTDSTETFHFQIVNPAAHYEIAVKPSHDTAFVKETRTRMLNVMGGLHIATAGGPRTWITAIWHVYALSAVITAVVVLLLSIYFWFTRSVKSRAEWLMISTAALFSISYILFIWLIG